MHVLPRINSPNFIRSIDSCMNLVYLRSECLPDRSQINRLRTRAYVNPYSLYICQILLFKYLFSAYLKFLQDFVIFPMIFTKVFHFFALRAASIVFHFSTLWVNFRAFWLVTNRSIQSTDTWTVGMPWEKAFSQLVYKAAVIHTPFPSIVIKDQIVITGGLVTFISRVVFMTDGSRGD